MTAGQSRLTVVVPTHNGAARATLAAAEYRAAHEGTIAPGKRADLVLLDADPLLDIANVSRVRAVIADGRLLDRTALDDLLSRARSAASK